MKLIFLDDSHARWFAFQSKIPSALRAETAVECIQMLKDSPEIDWLFLDHDLGGETYVESSREDCGMEVVRYLVDNPRIKSIHNIVVHSHNVAAANEMTAKLEDAGYNVKKIPFNNLVAAINFSP
jgi:CheY-like chemotaxis protein